MFYFKQGKVLVSLFNWITFYREYGWSIWIILL